MNKKREIFIISFLIISLMLLQVSLVYAAENETSADAEGFDKAYACLENLVKERGYSDLIPEEQAFSLLALAYDAEMQGNLRSALADSSNDNLCWPEDGCKLKETSLALIALNYINQPTNQIENWLLEKTTEPSEMAWYLQIDSDEKTECTVKYSGGSKKVTVYEDKRISGAGGACLSSTLNGYWLGIDDDCYDEEFEISCDKAFITALAFKKRTGTEAPYYISSVTHSAPADSKTNEKVNSLCFKQGSSSSCNYEGSLWAALALKKAGKDVSAFTPYLIALSQDNSKYLPSSFMFMLLGDDEYFTELINKQRTDGYWQTAEQNKRYYDTALALLALQGRSAEQATTATNYLLETQQSSGCWNNARDTAFILYAASPKNPTLSSSRTDCESSGYYCVSSEDTCTDAIGTPKSNYYCSSLGKSICCSVKVEEELPKAEPGGGEEANECEERGYYCKAFCNSETEDEKPYSCSGVESCCAPKTTATGERSYWWIWLLAILIILLALAIIFRNQLKIWIFRIKNKFRKGPVAPQGRPPMPPHPPAGAGMPMRLMPRRIIPGGYPMRRPMPMRPPARMAGAGQFPKENQLQETLKKLRDMSR